MQHFSMILVAEITAVNIYFVANLAHTAHPVYGVYECSTLLMQCSRCRLELLFYVVVEKAV